MRNLLNEDGGGFDYAAFDHSPFVHYTEILHKHGMNSAQIHELFVMWSEPHRVYHDLNHLKKVLELVENWKKIHPGWSQEQHEKMVLAAVFHDAVYNIHSKTNEEDSAELYKKMCTPVDGVYEMILDTKNHTKKPSSYESEVFLSLDIHILIFGTLSEMIEDEKKIFREFGFADFAVYKENRNNLLESFRSHILKVFPTSKFPEYLDWCKNSNKPRIAVYPGSFNPFHVGHYDILTRAEKMFDKVIILLGTNPAKESSGMARMHYIDKLKKALPNNQIEIFEGMLHAHVKSLPYPVTIIKGLRNEDDFKSEKTQLRFMEDLSRGDAIDICYIVGDRKYEHVSSSAIRQINSVGGDTSNYVFVK